MRPDEHGTYPTNKGIDWNLTFRNAHLTSWPVPVHAIANFKPSGDKDQGCRNIWEDDQKEILIAARNHGYVQTSTGHYIYFRKLLHEQV